MAVSTACANVRGTFHVLFHKASDLYDTELFGSQDPYVVAWIDSSKKEAQKVCQQRSVPIGGSDQCISRHVLIRMEAKRPFGRSLSSFNWREMKITSAWKCTTRSSSEVRD